jgi:nucleotide-binding universal stress UspA family protein
MYHSILVPLDGSLVGEQALPIACDIAQRSGATLQLVHVHMGVTAAPISVEDLPVIDERLESLSRSHEQAYLQGLCNRLADEYRFVITPVLLDSGAVDPTDQTLPALLADHVAASGTDLIVMTTHGRGGLARFWLGSVADVLVRISPAPILLLRPDEEVPEHTVLRPIQRILIPLDGSGRSEAIVDHALALGQPMQARYTLVRVVAPFVLSAGAPFTAPTDFDPDRTRRLQNEAQQYLDKVAQRMRDAGAQVQTRVLVSDQVAAALMQDAGLHNIDLIAMSTAGRSGLARLLLGSVADKVLRRVEVPLLLYRP